MNWQSFRALFLNQRFILGIYIAAAIITSVQLYLIGPHPFRMPSPSEIPADIMNRPELMNQFIGQSQTQYNNYTIFKCSWYHLIQSRNLYGIYPTQHWDFFKYSPTFALLMGLIAWLPDLIGLSIWNLLNVITLFFAIRLLPFTSKTQCLLLWFIFNEMLTCLTNCQSNGIMCGLIIAAYGCMEQKKIFWATLWLVLATYIKVYGAIGFCIFLFYPGKIRFLLYTFIWTAIFALLPLLVTTPQTLLWQYHNWASLMIADASTATGLSVNGLLNSWLGIPNSKWITLAGVLLFILPLARFRLYTNLSYRLLLLAYMLIWVIIFNHKAESPTYIIAVTGVGIAFWGNTVSRWRLALLCFVLVFTSLSTTDFFPPYLRSHFMQPYKIKVLPCIIAWIVLFFDLMFLKNLSSGEKENKILSVN